MGAGSQLEFLSPGTGAGQDRGPGGSKDFPGDSNPSPRPDPFSPHSPHKVPATMSHSLPAPALPSPIFHGIAHFSLCSIPLSLVLGSLRNLQELGSLCWILGGFLGSWRAPVALTGTHWGSLSTFPGSSSGPSPTFPARGGIQRHPEGEHRFFAFSQSALKMWRGRKRRLKGSG